MCFINKSAVHKSNNKTTETTGKYANFNFSWLINQSLVSDSYTRSHRTRALTYSAYSGEHRVHQTNVARTQPR